MLRTQMEKTGNMQEQTDNITGKILRNSKKETKRSAGDQKHYNRNECL